MRARALNTTNVFVYLMRNTLPDGINEGSEKRGLTELYWFNLTDNDIYIQDNYGAGDHEFRVIIWKISEP